MIIPFEEGMDKVIAQASRGIFLTVGENGRLNVMTIGWLLAGYMWNRNIIQIVIRTSRYSCGLLEEYGEFGISVPLRNQYGKELLFCGSNSGLTVDKPAGCGLPVQPPRKLRMPLVGGCERYYECVVLASQALPVESMDGDSFGENTADGHRHMMFYGEVRSSY